MRKLLLAALFALALAPSAQAAGPAFGIGAVGNWKLGYFVYDGAPGARLTGKVQVTNTGNRVGIVKLFATDATTGQTSGTVYLTSGQRSRDVGAWVSLPASRLELGPNERRIVPFTVAVPRGAQTGQHVGGIVAETAQQATGPTSKGKAKVQITVRNLAIVAVQVNVPGPAVTRFSILGVRAGGRKGYQQVLVRLRNDGNVMAKPSGTIVIRNDDGKEVLDERFQLDTFLPRTTIDYPVNVRKSALDVGRYTADIQLRYGGGQLARLRPGFRITPAQVAQVFTSAPPAAPPSARPTATTTTRPGGNGTSAAASPRDDSSGGGISPLLIALLALGGVGLLGAGYLLALRTARKA
jgi:hypothetical protein